MSARPGKKDDDPTDAELVESSREMMQAAIDRAIGVFAAGGTFEEYEQSESMRSETQRIIAEDVREIGHFALVVPPGLEHVGTRQWVYVERKNREKVFVVSWKTRMSLQAFGFADMPAFVDDSNEEN